MISRKTLIISLDGADWSLFDSLLGLGIMPNLKQLVDNGVRGGLLSTVPPVTATAWSSFMTSKNPGSHGLYDFLGFDRKKKETFLCDLRGLDGETLWIKLSAEGKKVGVVHVPMTYPPREVNGFLISGIPTPDNSTVFTYPPELKEEILSKVGEYLTFINPRAYDLKSAGGVGRYTAELRNTNKKINESVKLLLAKGELDFLMTHFQTVDMLQHALGHYIFATDFFEKASIYREPVIDFFSELDSHIGDILSAFDNNAICVVISDHGFGRVSKRIIINKFLQERGFLNIKQKPSTKGYLRSIIGSGLMLKIYRRLVHLLEKKENVGAFENENVDFESVVDWHSSKACVVHGSVWAFLYLNYDASQNKGKLEELVIKSLYELSDNGRKVIKMVYRSKDIYNGRYVEKAPDLIIVPEDGYEITSAYRKDKVFYEVADATHMPSGIMVFSGTDMKKGQSIEGAEIIDIAPTVLHAMGLPIPASMEGKVLEDIYDSSFEKINPIRYSEVGQQTTASAQESLFSEKENEEIRNMLKGLGYVD